MTRARMALLTLLLSPPPLLLLLLLTLLQMYQENPEKDFFDEVMDLIGTDSKDSAAVAVRLSSIVVHSCVLLLTYHRIRAPPQTSECKGISRRNTALLCHEERRHARRCSKPNTLNAWDLR